MLDKLIINKLNKNKYLMFFFLYLFKQLLSKWNNKYFRIIFVYYKEEKYYICQILDIINQIDNFNKSDYYHWNQIFLYFLFVKQWN